MKILLNFSNFSLGGWWGHPISLFWKLVDETQMAAPRKYTDAFIIIKKLFLGGLWGLQSNSIWYERPCRKFKHKEIQIWYVFLILSLHIWNSNFVYLVRSFLNYEFILRYATLNKKKLHIIQHIFSSFLLFWSPPVLPGTSTAHHNYDVIPTMHLDQKMNEFPLIHESYRLNKRNCP